MKKIFPILLLVIVAVGIYFFINKKYSNVIISNISDTPTSNSVQNKPVDQFGQNTLVALATSGQNNQNTDAFQPPLGNTGQRVTKKPFGIYITPKTSPVQPERFQGYHTGTDFEVFPEELNADVPIQAVCNGKLILKKYASGYGGVAVEACELDKKPVTVIYGHLNLASINAKIGDSLNVGEVLGNLGAAYSSETDGERKHLHLGFHKGTTINILGYVSSKSQLSDWIDPCLYVCM